MEFYGRCRISIYLYGVQVVGGSNPLAPTRQKPASVKADAGFLFSAHRFGKLENLQFGDSGGSQNQHNTLSSRTLARHTARLIRRTNRPAPIAPPRTRRSASIVPCLVTPL
ncbi:protein of unknown function [Burkholderia multivorans]